MGTESRNEKTKHIDRASTIDMLKIINEENRNSVEAVEAALPAIEKAVEAATEALKNGGRIIYVGAGTSGRLAIMDAAECPPTYGVDYNTVIAVIAGGQSAITRASEGAEDSFEKGEESLVELGIKKEDIVIGISAAGNAAFVLGAIDKAKKTGCVTCGLYCNKGCKIEAAADIGIFTDTGAEVVTGSTRMKAGNAQKMVLNMISTCAMIKTGKVYENLMINLKPSNIKLRKRMLGIVCDVLDTDEANAEKLLDGADWDLNKLLRS